MQVDNRGNVNHGYFESLNGCGFEVSLLVLE
jgi:hypothetical protein